MDVLEFENPIFKDGMNITVRRGIEGADLKGGVYLGEIEGEATQAAKVKDIKMMQFKDVVNEDLSLHHDPECRDMDGLTERMQEVYDDFDFYEIVTVIFFELVDE